MPATNSIADLVPVLVSDISIPFLKYKRNLVSSVYTMQSFANEPRGGQVVNIVLPTAPLATGQLSFTSANSPTAIVLPDVTLTINNFPYVKMNFNELEARISQGNEQRILKEILTGMAESTLQQVEVQVASLWPYFPIVGANNKRLDDETMRTAMVQLMNNRIDPTTNKVRFRGTSTQYGRDLFDIDRYVLATDSGVGFNTDGATNPLRTGEIPSLYNINASWNNAMPSQSFSGAGTEIGMLLEENAIGICFMKFAPVDRFSMGSAAVTEWWTEDAESGITLNWRMYFTPDPGIAYIQCSCATGVAVIDANRGRTIMSSTA